MDEEDIAEYINVGLCSIQRILVHLKKTSDAKVPKLEKPRIHQTLCDYDVEVCLLRIFTSQSDGIII
jgi:hypothetical protein